MLGELREGNGRMGSSRTCGKVGWVAVLTSAIGKAPSETKLPDQCRRE